MLFVAHGYPFIDQPYAAVGAALPDWLRRVRPRWRVPFCGLGTGTDAVGERAAQLRRGLAAHVAQDLAFHAAPAFHRELHGLTELLDRERAEGRRTFILAHVLLELLLDAWLLEHEPGAPTRYREALAQVDARAIRALLPRGGDVAYGAIKHFRTAGAVECVLSDPWIEQRLERLAQELRLPACPGPSGRAWVASARQRIYTSAAELLAPAWEATPRVGSWHHLPPPAPSLRPPPAP